MINTGSLGTFSFVKCFHGVTFLSSKLTSTRKQYCHVSVFFFHNLFWRIFVQVSHKRLDARALEESVNASPFDRSLPRAAAIRELGERGMMSLTGWGRLRRTIKDSWATGSGYWAEIEQEELIVLLPKECVMTVNGTGMTDYCLLQTFLIPDSDNFFESLIKSPWKHWDFSSSVVIHNNLMVQWFFFIFYFLELRTRSGGEGVMQECEGRGLNDGQHGFQ